jgi:RNA polymerase sigma-70 factor (ECF subfamily)
MSRPPKPAAEIKEEERWIRLCQKGDLDGLERLYERYHRQIYAYLLAMLRSQHAAEDLSQDVFVKLSHNLTSYRFQSPFHHWLFRLARNVAIDHLRREKVRSTTSLDAVPADGTPMKDRVREKGPDASAQAEASQRALVVRAAVLALPESFKEVVVLREWEDLSYEEIADRMDLSVGTVKSRLFRARGLLEAKLKNIL